MSSFTGPADIRVMPQDSPKFWDRPQLLLLSELVYYTELSGEYVEIHMPASFIFDGATTPRLSWFICPPVGEYIKPVALHDWLCETKTFDSPTTHAIFNEAMGVIRMNELKRRGMYWAVNTFGPRFPAKPKEA